MLFLKLLGQNLILFLKESLLKLNNPHILLQERFSLMIHSTESTTKYIQILITNLKHVISKQFIESKQKLMTLFTEHCGKFLQVHFKKHLKTCLFKKIK